MSAIKTFKYMQEDERNEKEALKDAVVVVRRAGDKFYDLYIAGSTLITPMVANGTSEIFEIGDPVKVGRPKGQNTTQMILASGNHTIPSENITYINNYCCGMWS